MSSTPPYCVRFLNVADAPVLWTMLVHAAHESSVTAVQANPDLARYVEGWLRVGDMGLVAEIDDLLVGAAWLRLWSDGDRGYGYLSDDIPELAIAVLPDYRAQGIGTALLEQVLQRARRHYPAVCLSIRADNPALRLYQRLGFKPVAGTEVTNRTGGGSFSMVYSFS